MTDPADDRPHAHAVAHDQLHRNAMPVLAAARDAGLALRIHEFPEGTRTAEDAAAAIGVGVAQIVKSLVFAVGATKHDEGEVVMALVSGANQLDERKLAAAAGLAKAWRVDADRARAATGFPVGGVAPFGHPAPLRTWIDPLLCSFDEVWAAAGTPSLVFPIAPTDLTRVAGAVEADLAKAAQP